MGGRIEEAAVQRLVSEAKGKLRAVSIPDAGNIKQDILTMQPCVVIVDAEAAVARSAQVVEMLELLPQLRILVVHVDSNVVEVFDKHEVTLRQASDLMDVITQTWPAASPVHS
jgi:hypothetical protein